jgi:hypothetical protein
VLAADNSTARLDLDNEPQPDAVLLIDPAHSSQARISADNSTVDSPRIPDNMFDALGAKTTTRQELC